MSLIASTIIQGSDGLSGIRGILHDTDATAYRWSNTKLLGYLNSAQRFVVMCNPKANVSNLPWQLAAGTFQTLPTGGIEIIDIMCNMGTGTTPGSAITLIERATLDQMRPAWRADTASATVQYWMFNEKDPSHFEVYPAQPSTGMGYVQGAYAANPTDIATINDAITIPDIYQSPLEKYVLFLAYSTETSMEALQQAVGYYNTCVAELDRKDLIMKTYSPRAGGQQ